MPFWSSTSILASFSRYRIITFILRICDSPSSLSFKIQNLTHYTNPLQHRTLIQPHWSFVYFGRNSVIHLSVDVLMLLLCVDEYWSNSQYCVHLQLPDRSVFSRQSPRDDKCLMVVSLLQKNSRRNRTLYQVQSAEVAMTFDLYKVWPFTFTGVTFDLCKVWRYDYS